MGLIITCQKVLDFMRRASIKKLYWHFLTTDRKLGEYPLSLVHSDVCGKVNVRSVKGAEYFVMFIDDKTHYTFYMS